MTDVLEIVVQLFASVREAVGREQVTVRVPRGSSAAALLDAVCEQYPPIARQRQALAVAVNHEIVPRGHGLEPGDEVALIPPVGGG